MADYRPLTFSNVAKDWINFSKNNMCLFSDYGLSYINTVLNSLNLQYSNDKHNQEKTNNNNTNNNEPISFIDPLSYYDSLFAISDSEFKKRLRSKDSLRHFKDYVESIANLESSVRQISFLPPFSFMDNFIDNYYQVFLNALVSINETPHKVAKQVDATRLLRYYSPLPHHPQDTSSSLPSERHAATTNTADADAPLLMVYAPINQYHILDLNPERSVVKKFVSAGFDVFLLDWGDRQSENKPTLADYIEYIDQSVEQIIKTTNQDKVNLYGYSWGGTLSIIYAATHNSKIKNLVLQSSNLDFDNDDTVIAEWMRNFPADGFVDEFKEMFGHFIDLAFLMRNPIAHSFDSVKYALEAKEGSNIRFVENLVKIRPWIYNTPDVPGPLFRQFAVDLYRQNLLIKNQLMLNKKEEKQVNETETISRKKAA